MKEETKSWIFNIIVVVLLVVLVLQTFLQKPVVVSDGGSYNYCVFWANGITRENIIWRAYNFKEQRINFDWHIDENDNLIMFNPVTMEEIDAVPCMGYTKYRAVELPSINVTIIDEREDKSGIQVKLKNSSIERQVKRATDLPEKE